MSTTPLTDSINALTTYANEVTGASDTTLSDAVYTLASGYGVSEFNPMAYISTMSNLFSGVTFSTTSVDLDFENNALSNCSYAFNACTVLENIVLKNGTFTGNLGAMFYNISSIKTITFENCTVAPTNCVNFARYASNLTAIYGEIDMSGCTSQSYMLYGCSALTHVEFKQNSINVGMSNVFAQSPFDDETLVNIANALDGTVTGKNVQFKSTQKTRCSEIVGTVTDGTFTADASGSVTLADFITNTKGWTLA